eukprot:SAG11_NODE_14829_length_598_cov_1.120240_1_plen_39_part_10
MDVSMVGYFNVNGIGTSLRFFLRRLSCPSCGKFRLSCRL